jgi:hypothetical protein
MFDLEQSITEWRRQMLAAGIKTPVPLEELEIHLREDVEQQVKSGLKEPEAFNVAARKIGQASALKKEFRKVKETTIMNILTMKKFIHAIILAVFGFGCLTTWGILKMAPVPLLRREVGLPAFTELCINLRSVLVVLPVLAAAYCVWVWLRKADRVPSWVGFFAAAMGVLVMVTLPAMVAAYLPLVSALNQLPAK